MSDSFVTEHAVSGLDAVRALSQTCRAWREFFLPMLWESVEVGMVNDEMKGVWYKVCSERLERVGNGIAGCGEVAELVRYATRLVNHAFFLQFSRSTQDTELTYIHSRKMRVVITQSNIDKAMPAFTSALKACVNLETINIHFADRAAGKHFNKGFPHGTVFPTIKALVIPAYAHALLRACPNVRRVVCNRGEVTPKLVTAIKSAGKNVQVLHGLHMEHTLLKRTYSIFPPHLVGRLPRMIRSGEGSAKLGRDCFRWLFADQRISRGVPKRGIDPCQGTWIGGGHRYQDERSSRESERGPQTGVCYHYPPVFVLA